MSLMEDGKWLQNDPNTSATDTTLLLTRIMDISQASPSHFEHNAVLVGPVTPAQGPGRAPVIWPGAAGVKTGALDRRG